MDPKMMAVRTLQAREKEAEAVASLAARLESVEAKLDIVLAAIARNPVGPAQAPAAADPEASRDSPAARAGPRKV